MVVEEKSKNVIVVEIRSYHQEVLDWAIVNVAQPGDCVVAVHVCRNLGHVSKHKAELDDYLDTYKGLCFLKKVELIGKVLIGRSARKVLVQQAKTNAAVALVMGMSKLSVIGFYTSKARYCAKRLPSTTNVLAIHNGKIVFRRCNNNQLTGSERDHKPSTKPCLSDFGDSEVSSFTFETIESASIEHKRGIFRSTSLFAEYIFDEEPGWPLLLRESFSMKSSAVQWSKSLPDRLDGFPFEIEKVGSDVFSELQKNLKTVLKTNSYDCEWFSYEVLRIATSWFSSENLIAKRGCNRVFKGILPNGKPVAVKMVKSSDETLKEFAHEVEIISSLNHKHITPLIGLCIEHNNLISVYRLLLGGSLEENLHGKKKAVSVLPWEVRFDVAVKIAEALSYLHMECSRPVIHRDVKSSNILLSDTLESQLSDFGLATWAPTSTSFETRRDVVGTFGYLAPEYFMYGKVSDKIDVYAFGVVLLELLSGRKPISSKIFKGQDSLVMWAKPMIECGDLRAILDPNLEGKVDEPQVQRTLCAATLCITRSARLRPDMSKVLKILKGESKDVAKCDNVEVENQEDNCDDEVYPSSSAELHLSLALLGVDDDYTSFSSREQSSSRSFEEYVKTRWSRSPSFD